MRSSHVIAFLLAAGVTGWIASGQFAKDAPGRESAAAQPPAQEDEPAPRLMRVRIIESRAQPMARSMELLGISKVSRRTTMRAENDGTVLEVGPDKGAVVKPGTVMVRLDEEDRPVKLVQAQALLKQRQLEYDAALALSERAIRSRTKLAEAETLLSAARASLEYIRLDLKRGRTEVPYDSVVESRPVEVGDFIKRGDPVAVIADLDPIKVVVNVPEMEIAMLRLGGEAPVEFIGGTQATGKVSYISSSADPQTRTFQVELDIPNPDLTLREGLTTKVLLKTAEVQAHLLTPSALTLSADGSIGLKTVDDDNRVQFHKIKLVADRPEGMWMGGLPDSLKVIVVGQEYVRVDQQVETVSVDPTNLEARK